MAAAESDATGASVLAEAASSGSGEMVDAVVIAMLDALKDEAVRGKHLSPVADGHFFSFAQPLPRLIVC